MSRNDHDVDRPDDDLTAEERAWMDDVPDRIDPPPGFRDLVVARLADSGELIRDTPGRSLPSSRNRRYALAAGFVLAFLAGTLAGRVTAPSGRAGGPAPGALGVTPDTGATGEARFILLLYEDEDYGSQGRTPRQLTAEYRAWSGDLENQGALVLSEKLGDDGIVVSALGAASAAPRPVPAGSPALAGDYGALTGFFIIRASSYEDAARLARESPHALYGGRIVIREIDPT